MAMLFAVNHSERQICSYRSVVPKLFEPGAGFIFLGPPRAKAREKSLHFESISDFAIFSLKIVVISKKKKKNKKKSSK